MTTQSVLPATRLSARHRGSLTRLLEAEPLSNAYLCSEMRLGVDPGEWWGVVDDAGSVRAAALGGAMVVPCIPRSEDALPLAEAISATAPPRILVGPRDAVLAMFRAMERPAREVREPQHLLALDRHGFRDQRGCPVRRAWRGDIDALVIAAAAMHREEMGVDPLLIDAAGWRTRMTSLVDAGWSWVWMEGSTVIFKAELSAWTPATVQIQGVWTHPDHRGRGIGCAGLAGMCRALLREVPVCTLYVNHFNRAALNLYDRLGFIKVGEYATVFY